MAWPSGEIARRTVCLLYTSDAADERSSVDLGGRRIIKKKKTNTQMRYTDDNTYKYANKLKKHEQKNEHTQAIKLSTPYSR